MKSDAVRSNRLNYLLKVYLRRPDDGEIYKRAKLMGVSDFTARDYLRTVILQARKMKT